VGNAFVVISDLWFSIHIQFLSFSVQLVHSAINNQGVRVLVFGKAANKKAPGFYRGLFSFSGAEFIG